MKQVMERLSRKLVLALTVVMMLGATPALLSAQSSGTGTDGYTRVLWQGTDSSIAIWKLDGNFNYVYGVNFGPYGGEIPMGINVGDDNYTRVMWRGTDGSIILWLLDPNLNWVSGYQYGPFFGWLPDSFSVDAAGYQRVTWKHTTGVMDIWLLPPNQNFIVLSAAFFNPGYIFGGAERQHGGAPSMFGNAAAASRAGRVLPKEMVPNFTKANTPIRSGR